MVSPPVRTSVFSTRFRDRVAQVAKRLEAEIMGAAWQLAAWRMAGMVAIGTAEPHKPINGRFRIEPKGGI